MELKADPERMDVGQTGVPVRAQLPDGTFGAVDIAHLDKASCLEWLRSRGGINPWAENFIAHLLAHDGPFTETKDMKLAIPRTDLGRQKFTALVQAAAERAQKELGVTGVFLIAIIKEEVDHYAGNGRAGVDGFDMANMLNEFTKLEITHRADTSGKPS